MVPVERSCRDAERRVVRDEMRRVRLDRDVSHRIAVILQGRRFSAERARATVGGDSGPFACEVTGYLVGIKQESKEQTNCEILDPTWYDWHAWLVATEAEAHNNDKTHAIVIEITPRVRAAESGEFDRTQIMNWSKNGTEVKVDGWLLLDPDHPNDVGASRGTIWEVHPVMKIGAGGVTGGNRTAIGFWLRLLAERHGYRHSATAIGFRLRLRLRLSATAIG